MIPAGCRARRDRRISGLIGYIVVKFLRKANLGFASNFTLIFGATRRERLRHVLFSWLASICGDDAVGPVCGAALRSRARFSFHGDLGTGTSPGITNSVVRIYFRNVFKTGQSAAASAEPPAVICGIAAAP